MVGLAGSIWTHMLTPVLTTPRNVQRLLRSRHIRGPPLSPCLKQTKWHHSFKKKLHHCKLIWIVCEQTCQTEIKQGCTTRGPNPVPEGVLFGPRSRFKNTTNASWMTEILWMNLNFIELSAILQLIAIQSSSDGNSIKPQATKRLVKLGFLYATLEMSAINFVSGPWVH